MARGCDDDDNYKYTIRSLSTIHTIEITIIGVECDYIEDTNWKLGL